MKGRTEFLNACHPERPLVGREGSAATADAIQSVASAANRVLQLIMATLREIFDENAYARFLVRHSLQPSRAAYNEFLRENSRARERRPRCC